MEQSICFNKEGAKMKVIEFYHDGVLLGGYSKDGTDHRDLVQRLFEFADDYDVSRDKIVVKEVER